MAQPIVPDPIKARQELHQGLIDLKWYSKSGYEFDQQFLDPHARNELYQGLVNEKMYSKSFEDFSDQFFGDLLKKKEEPATYSFPGQLDLSQPLSNQLQGGSGVTNEPIQEEAVAVGPVQTAPSDDSEAKANQFLAEAEQKENPSLPGFDKFLAEQQKSEGQKLYEKTVASQQTPANTFGDIEKYTKVMDKRINEEAKTRGYDSPDQLIKDRKWYQADFLDPKYKKEFESLAYLEDDAERFKTALLQEEDPKKRTEIINQLRDRSNKQFDKLKELRSKSEFKEFFKPEVIEKAVVDMGGSLSGGMTPIEKFNKYYNALYQDWLDLKDNQLIKHSSNNVGGKEGGLGLMGQIGMSALAGTVMSGNEDLNRYKEIEGLLQRYAPIALLNREPQYKDDSMLGNLGKAFLKGFSPAGKEFKTELEFAQKLDQDVKSLGLDESLQNVKVLQQAAKFKDGEYKDYALGDSNYWASMLGMTGGLMGQMAAGIPLVNSAMKASKVGQTLLKLADKGADLRTLVKAEKLAENISKSKTLGKAFAKGAAFALKHGSGAAISGAQYGGTGILFPVQSDELHYMGGLFGYTGEKMASALLPSAKRFTPILKRLFGEKGSKKAINALVRSGELVGRGIGETGEETGQELSQIFRQENTPFFEELDRRYGNLEDASKFLISTFTMGLAFGLTTRPGQDGAKSFKKGLDDLKQSNPAEAEKVTEIVNDLSSDFEESVGQTITNEKPKEPSSGGGQATVPKVEAKESVPVQGEPEVKGEEVDESSNRQNTVAFVVNDVSSVIKDAKPLSFLNADGTVEERAIDDFDIESDVKRIKKAVEKGTYSKEMLLTTGIAKSLDIVSLGQLHEQIQKDPSILDDIQNGIVENVKQVTPNEQKPDQTKGLPLPEQTGPEAVQQETTTKPETFGKGFKVIGVNNEGNKVGEDANGVRAVLNGRIVVTQPVGVGPGAGIGVFNPEGEFLTTDESKSQADKVAKDAGFDSPSHLINSVKKRTGKEYANVQDVPKDVLEETVKAREAEKEGKFEQIKEANPERILVVKPKKSDAKFDKARKSAAELLDLIGPGLKLNEDFDPEKNQKIIIKAGEVVANYLDAGITRFAEMVQDIFESMGENAARALFEPMKKGYGSQMTTVTDDVANKMDDLKTVRNAKIEDFIKAEEPASDENGFVEEITSLLGREKLDKTKIEKIGAKYGITDKNVVKEIAELAVVLKARELSKNDDFEGLVELYNNQPNLTHRTNESIDKQQYSTPAPIAYLMGKYLNLDKVKSALEPSAGNGMLTIVADPSVFTVNEIDPVRAANLQKQGYGEVLNQDGSQEFNRDKEFNAVVTNPPFGGTDVIKIEGYKFSELAQIMSVRGLEAMRDKGKAAIIIGGNNKYDEKGRLSGRDLIYFNYLFNKYNVEDVIDVDGDIYRKQGASFPIRIILINGRRIEANQDVAPDKKWFGKQENSFEGIKERIDKFQSDENIQPSELVGVSAETTGSRGAGQQTQVKSGGTKNVPGGKVRQPGEENAGDKSGTVRSGDVTSGGAGSGPGLDSGSNTGESTVSEPTGGEGSTRSTKLNEPKGTEGNAGQRAAKRERQTSAGIDSGESTVEYKPVSGSGSLNVSTPASLQQQASDALTDLVNDVGNVDDFVREKLGYNNNEELYKALSAEQIDGVALAIRNVDRGTGIIIGDQPGIGKGRQAAAMVRYAIQQGLVPIFLSKNPSLFSAIYRDFNDIGLGNVRPFILNAKHKDFPAIVDEDGKVLFTPATPTNKGHRDYIRSGKIPEGTKVILATYSQFSNLEGGPTGEKIDFLNKMAKGTIIVMDESHLASGEDSNTSEVFMNAIGDAKGVVFLSGTYAKRASNMPLYALKTSIRESNIESVEKLIEAIKVGGIPLQEILAGTLTESGEMIRRERTFKGIEVKTHVIGGDNENIKTKMRAQSDMVTGIMRDIIEFQKVFVYPEIAKMDDEIKGGRIRAKKGTKLGSVKGSPYFQKVFNVINQLLYAIKAEETANLIIAEHKAGRKPFLAIRATMESMIKDLIQRGELKKGDPFNTDFSFIMKKGLEGTTRITIENANGDKEHTSIPITQFSQAAQAHYKFLMQKIKNSKTGLSISPIDLIIEKLESAGLKVGEVTGRKYKIVTENGVQYLKPNTKLDQNKSYQKYNEGELDVLIVNRSGSTGVSAHSSSKFKDQTPRTMFILEAELDIAELTQMLFRINRSGQVNLPKYGFVSSPIPAEQRLIAMNTAKLKSLDAQTTSNQKQSSDLIESIDIFNKYGDQVVMEYLNDNPEINNEIGDPIKTTTNAAGEQVPEDGAAHKVTGKIAVLSTDKQENFYTEVAERYKKQIEFLNEAGINDLVIDTLPLKAKTLSKEIFIAGKGGRSKFGDNSYIEEVEVNTLKKPLTKAEIDYQIKQLSKDKEVMLSKLEEYRERRIEKINREVDERYKPKYESIEKDASSTPEDKVKATEELKEQEDFLREGKKTAEEGKIFFIKSLINFFTPGRSVAFPMDLTDVRNSGTRPAVFLGFDVDLESDKSFLPSNVSLKFAINDSRRSIGIASSKDPIINAIRDYSAQLSKTDNYENWDTLKKPKDRVKRYVVTGNILQALSDPRVSKGKIVKYDTEDGFIVTGVLQPEDFNINEVSTDKIKMPASKVEYIIRNLPDGKFLVNEEKTVGIKKVNPTRFEIRVPLAKQTGGKFYMDEDLNKIVVDGRWDSVSTSMQAFVEGDRLKELLDYLSMKHGVSFEVDKKSIEPEGDMPKTKASKNVTAGAKISPDTATGRAGKPKNQNVKPFNMANRIKEIFKKHGVPINEGSLRKKYDGVYKHMIKGVRVQSLWDLFVASHEMTHAIDNKYGMVEDIRKKGSKALHDELIHAYDNLYPSPIKSATLKVRIEEGLAMALEYYIAEPQMVETSYPEIVKQIFTDGGYFYQDEMGTFIKEMEEVLHDYQSLNPEEKINARIKWTGTKKEGGVSTWVKAQHKLTNDLITGNMVDEMMGGELRANGITPNVTMLRAIASIASDWIRKPFGVKEPPQTYVGNGQWANTKSGYRVEDYLKKLGTPKNIMIFNGWLIARRQYLDYLKLEYLQDEITNNGRTDLQERYNQLSSIVEKNNMPKELAEAMYNKFAKDFKEPERIFDAIQRDMIDFMESTGLIDMEKADEYRTEQGYASFQRYLEDETSEEKPLNLSTGAKATLNALRTRTGSDKQILPPTYSQLVAISETLRKGQLNLVWKGWADAAKQNMAVARIFEPVSVVDISKSDKGYQNVWINGKEQWFKLGEEAQMFAQALAPVQVDMLQAYMRGSARFFQAATTQLYAPFAIMNLSLDAATRYMHSQTGLIPVVHDVKTIGQMMTGLGAWTGLINKNLSNEFTKYMALGGRKQTLAGTMELEPQEALERILNNDWVNKAKKNYERAIMIAESPVNTIELMGRATEFRRAIKMGYPTNVAMYLAANVAVNFSNKGALANNYVNSVAYMGAGIQAFAQALKTARKNPARIATAIGIMATLAATGALAVYMAGDDDEKRQLADLEPEEYSKFIFLPGSVFGLSSGLIKIRIPETGGNIAGAANIYFAHLYMNRPLLFSDIYKSQEAALPAQLQFSKGFGVFGSYLPQAISPEIQTVSNTRFYPHLMPIVPDWMKDLDEYAQYDKYTSRTARAIGDLTKDGLVEVSPKKFDFYIRSKFGRTTTLIQSLAEAAIYNERPRSYINIFQESDRFMFTGRVYNKFYELRDEAKQEYAAIKSQAEIFNLPASKVDEAKYKLEEFEYLHKDIQYLRDKIDNNIKVSDREKKDIFDKLMMLTKDEIDK